jgi:outer membrane receptor for ferric coprogen and ferric-rhodotorulic acid
LPASAAATSIKLFSEQSGRGVIAGTDLVKGVRTNPVRGELTAADALNQMLAGTGLLGIEDSTSGTFAVRKATEAEKRGAPKKPDEPSREHPNKSESRSRKHTESMKTNPLLSKLAAAIMLVVAPATSSSQPDSIASGSSSGSGGGATIELSPFVVNSQADIGYYSPSTLSGTRLNSSLFDTPASVSEMTGEFLKDIGAVDLQEAVEYALGFENNFEGSNDNLVLFQPVQVRARGITTSQLVTRDYFNINSNVDTFATDRLSLARGPNSVLAGVGSAGGIINASSKRAIIGGRGHEVSVMFDDSGSVRAQLDTNFKLSERLAFRTNILYERRKTWRDLERTDSDGLQLAGTWRPFENTEIRAEYLTYDQGRLVGLRYAANDEYLDWVRAGSPAVAPNGEGVMTYPSGTVSLGGNDRITFISNNASIYNLARGAKSRARSDAGRTSGIKIDDPGIMPFEVVLGGPTSTSDNDRELWTLNLTQRLAERLYLDVGINESTVGRNVQRPLVAGDYDLNADPMIVLPGGVPNAYFGEFYVEGPADKSASEQNSTNLRAALSYQWSSRKLSWLGKHQWLAFWSRSDLESASANFREVNLSPLGGNVAHTSAVNRVWRRTYLDFYSNRLPSHYDHNPYAGTEPIEVSLARFQTTALQTGTVTPGFSRYSQELKSEVNESAMIAGQSQFLYDRLVVTYGYREDTLKQDLALNLVDPLTQEVVGADFSAGTHNTFSGATRTSGAVFKLFKGLAAYYNKADNFSPQGFPDFTGGNVGNVKGKGEDYGLKFQTANGRFYAKFGRFETGSTNQAVLASTESQWFFQMWEVIEGPFGPNATHLANGAGRNWDTRDTVAEGYEAEVVASPVNGLRLMFNWSQTTGATQNSGPRMKAYFAKNLPIFQSNSTLDLVSAVGTVGDNVGKLDQRLNVAGNWANGGLLKGSYKYRYNFRGHYRFSEGRLRGLDVGLGVRVRERRYITADVYGPRNWYADLSVGYDGIKLGSRVKMSLKLDVTNLLDRYKVIYISQAANGADTLLYDYSLEPPRAIRLTSTFRF